MATVRWGFRVATPLTSTGIISCLCQQGKYVTHQPSRYELFHSLNIAPLARFRLSFVVMQPVQNFTRFMRSVSRTPHSFSGISALWRHPYSLINSDCSHLSTLTRPKCNNSRSRVTIHSSSIIALTPSKHLIFHSNFHSNPFQPHLLTWLMLPPSPTSEFSSSFVELALMLPVESSNWGYSVFILSDILANWSVWVVVGGSKVKT